MQKTRKKFDSWSPAEERHMDSIVQEVLNHMRNGTGNGFIRGLCDRYVTPELRKVRPGAFA